MGSGGVPGVGANKDPRASCIGIGCFFFMLTNAGLIFLALSFAKNSEMSLYDAATDFDEYPGKCMISDVSHEAMQENDGTPYCVDSYTYTFSSMDNEYLDMKSAKDEKSRGKPSKCDDGTPLGASFTIGEDVSCWIPAIENSTEYRTFYSCGNAMCLKVIDPALDHASAGKQAKVFIILGGIMFPVGCIGLLVTVVLLFKMPEEDKISKRVGLFQAPILTFGHRCTGLASIVGCFFVIGHIVTVIITCVVSGFGWGATAWCLDLMGFFAGVIFVPICRKSSCAPSQDTKIHQYIAWWSFMTLGSRVVDTLMLLGIVQISAIYHTPSGAVLATNLVTEVFLGNVYTLLAVVGSANLVFCPKDKDNYVPLQES